ncbi:MAG: hypothetical protein IPN70_02185 [Candidatus Moraniibacteriota bacterium]|nr:MAG: hypothetical protein IPN70_02185 [Candidatus Moranbacteria bacterium]
MRFFLVLFLAFGIFFFSAQDSLAAQYCFIANVSGSQIEQCFSTIGECQNRQSFYPNIVKPCTEKISTCQAPAQCIPGAGICPAGKDPGQGNCDGDPNTVCCKDSTPEVKCAQGQGSCKASCGANEKSFTDSTSPCKGATPQCCIPSAQSCSSGNGVCFATCSAGWTSAGECPTTPTTPKCCTQNTTQDKCQAAGGSCVSDAECTGTKLLSIPCDSGKICCKVSTPPPGGSAGGGTSAYYQFLNPFKYNTLQQVITAMLNFFQGVIVVLSLVFIIIGAVLYITSSGNEKMLTLAKGAILASMIGLALGIAAPTFLNEIYTIVGGNTEIPTEVSEATSIYTILMNTLNLLLTLIGTLSIIMMVVGGIMYLFSGGSEARIEAGKKIVIFSGIGLVVALISLIVVRQIAMFFG